MLGKLLQELKPYTFSSDVMYNITSKENVKNKFKPIIKPKIVSNNFNLKYFIPNQKDTLFWCLYYVMYGDLKYQQVKNHCYENEKNMKIDSVKVLRNKKDILKQNNIKLTEVENNLAGEEIINEKVLHALCLIYEKRVILVKELTYLDIGLSESIDGIIFIRKGDYRLLLNSDNSTEQIKENCEKHYKDKYLISNPQKPIRAISYYTLTDLHNIATCLKINIYDTNGKKILKRSLYENILAIF